MADVSEVKELELFAWVGWDEYNSGELGIKQGHVPAGMVPMVVTASDRHKLEKYWQQAEMQAEAYGKRIFLVRLEVMEIVKQTESGGIG